MKAGDTTLVRGGTYSQRVFMGRSGTAAKPMTLRAYGSEKPVLTAQMKIWGAYLRISGFVFKGQTAANPNTSPLYLAGAKHVEISRSEITKSKITGVYLGEGSNDIRLIANWIHDNGTSATLDHGIYWHRGTLGVIANNIIVGNSGYGVQLYPDSNDVLVTSNTVISNGKSGIIVGGDWASKSDRNTIVNNIVAFNAEWGIRSYWSGAVGAGNTVLTNLVYGNGSGDFGTGSLALGLTFSDNLSLPPGFVSSGSNYALAAGSPAIDRAVVAYAPSDDYTGAARPRGAGPDLGAFEY